MQVTFFVGNGFDVSCGIHSKYNEFYEWYCKQEKSELPHVNVFRETINRDITEGKDNWADFEEALGKYTEHFTVDTVQQFIDCYNDASEKLMKYLQNERDRFEEEIISDEELQRFINGLKGFYLELRPKERSVFEQLLKDRISENRVINFVSYNYTDTLDKCVSGIGSQPISSWNDAASRNFSLSVSLNVIHAHGRLTQNPVFGVNDESQIANKELLTVPDFKSIMIKPRCVEELGEFWHDQINTLIDNSTIICVFGMSMGVTDSIWFSRIIQWLNANLERQLIIYWQTDKPSGSISNARLFANRREAREKILNFSNISNQERDRLSTRIHIIENTENVLRVSLREKAAYTMNGDNNELLEQAVKFAIQDGQLSTSTLQRRMKIGYAQAEKLMDMLNERGIVTAKDGSKPRKCLITQEEWNKMKSKTGGSYFEPNHPSR